jgi:hypothetical protein
MTDGHVGDHIALTTASETTSAASVGPTRLVANRANSEAYFE